MYYTHGDTVIFRSDPARQDRTPPRSRERESKPERAQRRPAVSVEQVLTDRVTQLEARLAKLEAELGEARKVQGASPQPPPSGGGRRSRGGRSGEVKVSLHAEGGAQATAGQVRMINEQ